MQRQEVLLKSLVREHDGQMAVRITPSIVVPLFAARVLAARPDLAEVKLVSRSETPLLSSGQVWLRERAEIVWDEENFSPGDSIVLVRQLFGLHHPECNSPQEVFEYDLIAGEAQWTGFGERWAEWVLNPEVQASAKEFIRSVPLPLGNVAAIFQELASLLSSGANLQWPRERDFRFWLLVGKVLLSPVQFGWLRQKTCCRRFSEVAVAAMPVRIASCLGWVPSVPRPQWVPPVPGLVELPVVEQAEAQEK